jgi:hypothetical protein
MSQREVEVYSSRVLHERRKGGGASEADSAKKLEATPPPDEATAQQQRMAADAPTVPMRDQIAPRRVQLPRGQ